MFKTDLTKYQQEAHSTAIYPTIQTDPIVLSCMYAALGLTGEAGEVAEKIKKWHRDGHINAEEFEKELGDVIWYVSELATILGLNLESLFEKNLIKLQKRKQKGTLGGEGDNR